MEKKLRELIDRQEIWQVMQRYGRAVDRMDRELLRSCYFEDAIDDHGRFVGTVDGFIDWVFGPPTTSSVTTQHGLMNHSCELDGDDAYAETYFQSIGVHPEPPHLMSIGRYVDHFQRRNGEWRIANRVVIVEKTFSLQGNEIAARMPAAYGPDEAQPTARDRTDISYHRPPRPRAPPATTLRSGPGQ